MVRINVGLIILLLPIIFLAGLNESGAQENRGNRDWLKVKAWKGTFSITREFEKKASLQEFTETVQFQKRTTGSFILDEKYVEEYSDNGPVSWSGSCSGQTTVQAKRRLEVGEIAIVEELSGTGSACSNDPYEPSASIYIDLDSGTYDGSFSTGSPKIEFKRKVEGKEKLEAAGDHPLGAYFSGIAEGMERMDDSGLAEGMGMLPGNQQEIFQGIADALDKFMSGGEEENGKKLPSSVGPLSGSDYDPVTKTKIEWSASPTDVTFPKVWLALEDSEWLPRGGNFIEINLEIEKGNVEAVEFSLFDVSNEPGTCLNSPDMDENPDLEFAEVNTSSGYDMDKSRTKAHKKTSSLSEKIMVRSHDYGAYGKARARVLVDGTWVDAKMKKNGNKHLNIPEDENDNHIADAWEKENQVWNTSPEADDDNQPEGDGTEGDGLSAYEEYRGILAQADHKRLNPKVKTLIVDNRIGSMAESGLALFSRATQLEVVDVRGELDQSRVVNMNAGTGHNGKQHGLLLISADLDGIDAGEALPPGHKKSPKDCTMIRIGQFLMYNLDHPGLEGRGLEVLDHIIAHELGHGVGLRHHGDKGGPVNDVVLTESNRDDYLAYDEMGREITTRPYQIEGKIGWPNGTMSGDLGCIMTYFHLYAWAVHYRDSINYENTKFYKVPKLSSPKGLCTSPKGTGINSNKAYFGDADSEVHPQRGNCSSMLQVNDLNVPN